MNARTAPARDALDLAADAHPVETGSILEGDGSKLPRYENDLSDAKDAIGPLP